MEGDGGEVLGAVPLYLNLRAVRRTILPMLSALAIGSLVAIVSSAFDLPVSALMSEPVAVKVLAKAPAVNVTDTEAPG